MTLAVYVPDRKPMVHFTGKSYVLPSRGQQGIPLVAINTGRVDVEVYRIGDRSLANAIEQRRPRPPAAGLRPRNAEEPHRQPRLQGRTRRRDQAQRRGHDRLPGQRSHRLAAARRLRHDRAPCRCPARRLARTARRSGSSSPTSASRRSPATTACTPSCARSPAPTPIADASVRLIARNNEVLATAKTDKNGYVRFEPGQSKGEGGNAPAILVAENGAGEYAFLDLSSNAFDLSDRGVKGRDAPGPLDGYLYTERGVYRPGEEVNVTALVRDGAGAAASLPDDTDRRCAPTASSTAATRWPTKASADARCTSPSAAAP